MRISARGGMDEIIADSVRYALGRADVAVREGRPAPKLRLVANGR